MPPATYRRAGGGHSSNRPIARRGARLLRRTSGKGAAASAPSFSPLSLTPALWIDPSDAASVTISGSSGAYIGANGLVCPAAAADNGTSAPNVAAHNITGDIDIIVKVTATDWTPATDMALVAKDTATRNWNFYIAATTGRLGFYWFNAAASIADVQSSVGTGVTDGAAKWVRVTLDVDNGASGRDVKFWTSDDGSSWTQLGTTSTAAGVTDVRSTTDYLTCGFRPTGNRFGGTIHRAIVKNGIAGTTVFDADFESATPFVSAFTESALGAPVYVVSSTATSSTASYRYVGPAGLIGTNSASNYATLPANVAYDVEDFEFVARVSLSDWDPGDYRSLYTHGGILNSTERLGIRVTNRIINLDWYDGTTVKGVSSTTSMPDPGDGIFVWLKVTFDYNAGGTYAADFYYAADQSTEPSSWTQIGTQVTGAQASGTRPTNKSVTIASLAGYSSRLWDGTIKRVIVRNAIGGSTLIDADFTTAADYCTTFTESSSNAATVTITATNTPANAAGACVSQINDKSGNNRHLTQGTLANMPKYWNGQNGCNCLVFGIASSLNSGALTSMPASSELWFFHNTQGDVKYIPFSVGSAGTNMLAADAGSASTPTAGMGSPTLYVNGSGSTSTFATRIDAYNALNGSKLARVATADFSGWTTFGINVHQATFQLGSGAYIGSVIMLSATPAAGDVTNLWSHMNTKWAVY